MPRLTLLVAEDNPPDALLVRKAIEMEQLSLDLYEVSDGEQAIRFIERAGVQAGSPHPHLLLLDLNLPRVNGFEVLKKIRSSEKYKRMPVMVMTSSDSPWDLSEVARLGADYFHKPMSYSEFLQIGPALRKLIEASGLLETPVAEVA